MRRRTGGTSSESNAARDEKALKDALNGFSDTAYGSPHRNFSEGEGSSNKAMLYGTSVSPRTAKSIFIKHPAGILCGRLPAPICLPASRPGCVLSSDRKVPAEKSEHLHLVSLRRFKTAQHRSSALTNLTCRGTTAAGTRPDLHSFKANCSDTLPHRAPSSGALSCNNPYPRFPAEMTYNHLIHFHTRLQQLFIHVKPFSLA